MLGATFTSDERNTWTVAVAVADRDGAYGNGDVYTIRATYVPDPSGADPVDGSIGQLVVTGSTRDVDAKLVAEFVVALVTAAQGDKSTRPPRQP